MTAGDDVFSAPSSAATIASTAVHVDPAIPVHPLSVADVDAMVGAGILGEEDRVELLDGVLVEMSSPSSEHSKAVRRLTMIMGPFVDDVVHELSTQNPLDLGARCCRPEPDVAIVPRVEDWARHAAGALLVVEVSVSSRRVDLGRKAEIYAAARIPEYWVLDIEQRVLMVHRSPSEGRYRDVRSLAPGATVTALAVELSVPVAELLPPAA